MLNINQLVPFLSSDMLSLFSSWAKGYPLYLVISKPRIGKYGDYRYIPEKKTHKITINNDLPTEMFFLTLTHEIAHMYVLKNCGRQAPAHGKQWKQTFGRLIIESIHLYRKPLQKNLMRYAKNPTASLHACGELLECMPRKEDHHYLKELSHGQWFVFNGKIFKKGRLRRTRFLCELYASKKIYLIHKTALVKKYAL